MIKLTQLTQELTEEGEDKLQKLLSLQAGVAEEEEDEWTRMGLPNPNKDSDSKADSRLVEFVDYNMVETELFVRPEQVEAVLGYKEGSEVFMISGTSFIVAESPSTVWLAIESY
jgi:hypothetical protein